MLFDLIKKRSLDSFIADERTKINREQLLDIVVDYQEQLMGIDNNIIKIFTTKELPTIALIIAGSELDKTLVLVPKNLEKDSMQHGVIVYAEENFKLKIIKNDLTSNYSCPKRKGIIFYTSGTTGKPKPLWWKWDALIKKDYLPAFSKETCWLSAYSINSFASIQAMAFGFAAAEQLYFLEPTKSINILLEQSNFFDKVLSTPTFWRRNLFFLDPLCKVKTASLGGEPVSQQFIDLLIKKLSLEKITHIYASTEYGSIYSISDGLAGFPISSLNQSLKNGNTLEIKDQELFIKPPGATSFYATGDLVELYNDRVLIVGRKEDLINVGGSKILIGKIEEAILEINGVEQVRVYGIPNPITGNIVGAEIVINKDVNESQIKSDIKRSFNEKNFNRAAFPRIIKFVSEIELTRTGKKKRIYG